MNRPLPLAGDVKNYYRLHARVYDLSRWAFLFGRDEIITRAAEFIRPARLLEIGCGTGRNLHRLRMQFPDAELHGLDLSADMLRIARRRLGRDATLWQQAYGKPLTRTAPTTAPFDLILASYALSMFNPGRDRAIDCLCRDLAPGGCLALVDFHDTPHHWFKRWMAMNHVRMDGHLQTCLDTRLSARHAEIRPAYAGLWRYCLYIGNRQLHGKNPDTLK